MPLQISKEILSGSRAVQDERGWSEIDSLVLVTGIEDVLPGATWIEVVNAAIEASEITLGMVHPVATNLRVYDIDTEAIDKNQVKLTFRYRRSNWSSDGFEDDALEVGASVVQEETNTDKDGNDMELHYIYKAGYKRSPHDTALLADEPEPDKCGHVAGVMKAQVTWSVNKIESISKAALKAKAKTYVGKVNSEPWDDSPARTVMCMRILGRSTDGGSTFNVVYDYQYKGGGWDHLAIYIQDNGKPPHPDKITSADKTEWAYQVQEEISFGSLPA